MSTPFTIIGKNGERGMASLTLEVTRSMVGWSALLIKVVKFDQRFGGPSSTFAEVYDDLFVRSIENLTPEKIVRLTATIRLHLRTTKHELFGAAHRSAVIAIITQIWTAHKRIDRRLDSTGHVPRNAVFHLYDELAADNLENYFDLKDFLEITRGHS